MKKPLFIIFLVGIGSTVVLFYNAGWLHLSSSLSSPAQPPSTPIVEDPVVAKNRSLYQDEDLLVFCHGDPQKLRDARTDLEKITTDYPQDERARALLGLAKITAYEDGMTDVEQSLALVPGNITALRTKINFLLKNDEVELAEQAYKELVKYHPDNDLVNLYRARFANRRLEYATALSLVTKELDTKRSSMSKIDLQLALIIQEFSAEHTGRFDIVEEAFQGMVNNSNGVCDYRAYALFLIHQKHDYPKAIEIMKKGLDQMDLAAGRITLQEAYFLEGKRLYEQKKYEEAMNMFDHAAEAYPYDSYGHFLQQIASYYYKYGILKKDQIYLDKSEKISGLIEDI